MRVYPDLTHARLCEVLDYNPDTGIWTWKVKTGPRVKIGARAGCISSNDYGGAVPYRHLSIGVDGVQYRSARLAYFYMKGEWPPAGFEVDHKSTDSLDDRWDNLRLATSGQQKLNRRGKGRLGLKGVDLHKASGLYRARIMVGGKFKSLGYYKTAEEAHGAYRRASAEAHGEFSNTASMLEPTDNVVTVPAFFPPGSRENPFVWELIKHGKCASCGVAGSEERHLESFPNPCMDGNFWGYLCYECHALAMAIYGIYGFDRARLVSSFLRRHEHKGDAA